MVLSDLELYYIDLLAGFLSERTFGQQKYYNVDSGGHPRCNKFCKKTISIIKRWKTDGCAKEDRPVYKRVKNSLG